MAVTAWYKGSAKNGVKFQVAHRAPEARWTFEVWLLRGHMSFLTLRGGSLGYTSIPLPERHRFTRMTDMALGGGWGKARRGCPLVHVASFHPLSCIMLIILHAHRQMIFHVCEWLLRLIQGGPQRLDRTGHGRLKDLSRKAVIAALHTHSDNACKRTYRQTRERTPNAIHARLTTQRKILAVLRALGKGGTEYQDDRVEER